jgi:hypothetical protein
MSYHAPDGLLRNVQQSRLTPKSEFLLDLERRQAEARECAVTVQYCEFDDSRLPALLRRQAT